MPIILDGQSDFCYLSLVTDYYTNEIIGWCVGETLEAKFTIEALKMVLRRLDGKTTTGLIHHSPSRLFQNINANFFYD
ncbi:MAG: hypothetical protein J6R79_04940 [Bacteroidaceae bacterium]|nr:hypothetical protein [Bacteroidaceae bacterium]